jgi:hypothetical protein
MVNANIAGILTAALIIGSLPASSQTSLPEPAASDMFGKEPGGPAKPAPRTPDGHLDLNGHCKGLRTTRPVGNIGKDLPGFKLPFTPEGEAAWKHNVTAAYDPEALCIPGGIPRHKQPLGRGFLRFVYAHQKSGLANVSLQKRFGAGG